jgi:hypothetical protein
MSLTPTAARANLVEALRLDLVGPDNQQAFARGLRREAPSRCYLTGFLVARSAPEDHGADAEADDSLYESQQA